MKRLITLIVLCLGLVVGWSQTTKQATNRLQDQVDAHPQPDTGRVRLLNALAEELLAAGKYSRSRNAGEEALDLAQGLNDRSGTTTALLTLGLFWVNAGEYLTALDYFRNAEQLARQSKDWATTATALRHQSDTERQLGNYAPALDAALRSLRFAQQSGQRPIIALSRLMLGIIYVQLGEYDQAMPYLRAALAVFRQDSMQRQLAATFNVLGEKYRAQGNWPQALAFYQQSLGRYRLVGDSLTLARISGNLAYVYEKQGRRAEALALGHQALDFCSRNESPDGLAWLGGILGRTYLHLNCPDRAIFYARQSLAVARTIGSKEYSRDASQVLAEAYALRRDWAAAYQYQTLYVAFRDSVSGQQTQRRVAALRLNDELNKKQAQIALLDQNRVLQAKEVRRQRQLLIATLFGLGLAMALAVMFWSINRQKHRANTLLEQQRSELQRTLDELKNTQNQLIQKEKMASLGELTAGIAHEIQNPLNFVNNFSEVSVEMIGELQEEREKGQERDEVLETELIVDIEQNLEKIAHHGSRASNIVKGMLEHARASTGERQPTDLNALADEYLRLAYHGLRAKDKNGSTVRFNAELVTAFEPKLGMIHAVPQDLGRVLLNLFNNAFYAVSEKKNQQPSGYEPTVSVRTQRIGNQVEIRVGDNGTGIPDAVKAKIFQPFFTTKPTGSGTGLGLSLAYDIVTKGHGGTLEVETKEGEGTEFIIRLPAR